MWTFRKTSANAEMLHFVTSAWFEMLCSFIAWTYKQTGYLLNVWTQKHSSVGSVFSQRD